MFANADDGTPQRLFMTDREYTPEGHLDRLMYPGGHWTDLSPDGLGRSLSVSADGVGTLANNTTYYANGAVKDFNYAQGGGMFSQTLDARLRPSRLHHTRGGASVLDLGYSYDANSRITQQADAVHASRTRDYAYDAVGRLTRAAANDNLHGAIDYAYDSLRNLRRKDYTGGQYDGRNIELKYINNASTDYANNTLQFSHDRDANGDFAYTGKRWYKHDRYGNVPYRSCLYQRLPV